MPSKYDKDTLPVPKDSTLDIREVPRHSAIVHTHFGASVAYQLACRLLAVQGDTLAKVFLSFLQEPSCISAQEREHGMAHVNAGGNPPKREVLKIAAKLRKHAEVLLSYSS